MSKHASLVASGWLWWLCNKMCCASIQQQYLPTIAEAEMAFKGWGEHLIPIAVLPEEEAEQVYMYDQEHHQHYHGEEHI